jgi:hypothetical protein
MQKLAVLTALVLIIIIVFAVVMTLQFRRDRRKERNPHPHKCEQEEIKITSLGVGSYVTNGRIGPHEVFQGDVSLNVQTDRDFHNGGLILFTEYPNLQENGTVIGLSLRDIESGNSNTVVSVPCTIGSALPAHPNSSTCTTSVNRKGWTVSAATVRTWRPAQNVHYAETLASPQTNNYTITWDPLDGCNVYVVSLTLEGNSYDPDENIVPTRLAFGGLTSGTTLKLTTGGSDYFTADIPSVKSVQVLGFHHCDLNADLVEVCVGEFDAL